MRKLSIYIIEDEELYASQLEMLVDKLEYDLAGISDNSDTAKVEIQKFKPDLLLVDVNINGTMDGIELMTSLDTKIPCIFITSFQDDETYNRAKKVGPHAYLEKPFNEKSLERNIELALNASNTYKEEKIALGNSLFVKNRNTLTKIEISDINYLEVEDRYSTIHTNDGKKYVLRMSMNDVQDRMPEDLFFRIHRKYSININRITSLDLQDNLIYIDDTPLSISRSKKDELLQKLEWLQ